MAVPTTQKKVRYLLRALGVAFFLFPVLGNAGEYLCSEWIPFDVSDGRAFARALERAWHQGGPLPSRVPDAPNPDMIAAKSGQGELPLRLSPQTTEAINPFFSGSIVRRLSRVGNPGVFDEMGLSRYIPIASQFQLIGPIERLDAAVNIDFPGKVQIHPPDFIPADGEYVHLDANLTQEFGFMNLGPDGGDIIYLSYCHRARITDKSQALARAAAMASLEEAFAASFFVAQQSRNLPRSAGASATSMTLLVAQAQLRANWGRLNAQEMRMVIGTASAAVFTLAAGAAPRIMPVLRNAIASARAPEMAAARVASTRLGARFATIVVTLGVGTMAALTAPLNAAVVNSSVPQGMNTIEWFFTEEGVQRIATYNDRNFTEFVRGELLEAWVVQLAEAIRLLN